MIANAIDGTDAQVVEGEDDLWFPNSDAAGNFVAYAVPGGSWVVRSLESNRIEYRAPDGWSIRTVSNDGAKVVIHRPRLSGPEEGDWFTGRVRLVDTRDGNGVDLAADPTALSWFSPDGEIVVVNSVAEVPRNSAHCVHRHRQRRSTCKPRWHTLRGFCSAFTRMGPRR